MKAYYKDDYSTISVDEMVPCLFQKFQGMAHSSDHYRQVHSISLDLLNVEIKHFTRLHMLIDSSEAGAITKEDVEYHNTTILPNLYHRGVRYIAFIPPIKKISGIIFNEAFNNTVDNKLIIQNFTSLHEAKKWLRNMN